MPTGRKFHGKSFHISVHLLWTYRSIIGVPTGRSTARSFKTANHTCIRKLPIWSCNKISFLDLVGCLFKLLSFKKPWRLPQDTQVGCTIDWLIQFWPAPVFTRAFTLFILCTCRAILTWVLLFVIVDRTVSVHYSCNWKISAPGTGESEESVNWCVFRSFCTPKSRVLCHCHRWFWLSRQRRRLKQWNSGSVRQSLPSYCFTLSRAYGCCAELSGTVINIFATFHKLLWWRRFLGRKLPWHSWFFPQGMGWKQLKAWVAKTGRMFFFYSVTIVHYDITWYLDKGTLQHSALFIVDKVSGLAIMKDNASHNARNDCDTVWSIAIFDVFGMFLVSASGLRLDRLLTVFMPDFWGDQGLPYRMWDFDPAACVLMGAKSCPFSRIEDVTWNARSCRIAPFLIPLLLTHTMSDRDVQAFNENIYKGVLDIKSPQRSVFIIAYFACWDGVVLDG